MPIANAKNRPSKLVGRAELKLTEAARAFGYDFRGKLVLDIGSSTGGFTEYALRHGAQTVVAVEKGTKQMKAPLRFDPKVVLLEKTDIFDVRLSRFRSNHPQRAILVSGQQQVAELSHGLDVVLADVSFLSLTKVLAHAQKYLADRQTDFLVMLKPQFEARPDQLVNGVVKNERMRREIMQHFERWLLRNGFLVVQKRDNATVGKVGGNHERFYYLKLAKPLANQEDLRRRGLRNDEIGNVRKLHG